MEAIQNALRRRLDIRFMVTGWCDGMETVVGVGLLDAGVDFRSSNEIGKCRDKIKILMSL